MLQHSGRTKRGRWRKTVFYPGTTPTMFCTASFPNLKTPVITFVNAHTIGHYLQTLMLSSNKTLSIECCSETSINLVSSSIVISFHVALVCAFVICLLNYLLTGLEFSRLESWSRDVSRPVFTSLGLGLGLGTLQSRSRSWSWDLRQWRLGLRHS